jgi:hypothetical protein
MKLTTTITTIALLALAATAHAELGDTYTTSCNRFHGPGFVDRTTKTISWEIADANPTAGKWAITEQFNHNRCVAIIGTYLGNEVIGDGAIWQTLTRNSDASQTWHEYGDPSKGRNFVTNDDKVYGAFWYDSSGHGNIRVAYKSWLMRNHVFTAPNQEEPASNSLPPVQESSI